MLDTVFDISSKQHPTKQQLYSHLPYILQAIQDEQDMLGTAGELRMNLYEMLLNELLHVDKPVMLNQQKFTFIRSVQTLGMVNLFVLLFNDISTFVGYLMAKPSF